MLIFDKPAKRLPVVEKRITYIAAGQLTPMRNHPSRKLFELINARQIAEAALWIRQNKGWLYFELDQPDPTLRAALVAKFPEVRNKSMLAMIGQKDHQLTKVLLAFYIHAHPNMTYRFSGQGLNGCLQTFLDTFSIAMRNAKRLPDGPIGKIIPPLPTPDARNAYMQRNMHALARHSLLYEPLEMILAHGDLRGYEQEHHRATTGRPLQIDYRSTSLEQILRYELPGFYSGFPETREIVNAVIMRLHDQIDLSKPRPYAVRGIRQNLVHITMKNDFFVIEMDAMQFTVRNIMDYTQLGTMDERSASRINILCGALRIYTALGMNPWRVNPHTKTSTMMDLRAIAPMVYEYEAVRKKWRLSMLAMGSKSPRYTALRAISTPEKNPDVAFQERGLRLPDEPMPVFRVRTVLHDIVWTRLIIEAREMLLILIGALENKRIGAKSRLTMLPTDIVRTVHKYLMPAWRNPGTANPPTVLAYTV